jgi:hypothetical protein
MTAKTTAMTTLNFPEISISACRYQVVGPVRSKYKLTSGNDLTQHKQSYLSNLKHHLMMPQIRVSTVH